MNRVLLIGELVRDPRIAYTKSGAMVANFCLKCQSRATKDGKGRYDYANVSAWEACAASIANSKAGATVVVDGQLQSRSYEKDGKKVWVTEVNASLVEVVGAISEEDWSSVGPPPMAEKKDEQPQPADDTIPF